MFFKCLKSEFHKFLCDRYLLAITVGLIILMPFSAMTLGSYCGESGADLLVSKMLQGSYLGQVGFVIMSAMFFGSEFKRSTLRTCLLCTPKRWMFLVSKTVGIFIITSIILIISEAASITCLLLSDPSVESNMIMRMIVALIPAYISMIELVFAAAALTIITTSQLISMSVFVSLILGLNGLLLQFGRCMRYIPVTLSMNAFLIYPQDTYLPISQGLLYQGLWSLALIVTSFAIFIRRPVR